MPWYARPAAALAWLGRQGTRAVALSLLAGLALPRLAAAMKPLFTPSVFVLLCLAFLRVDPDALRRRFARLWRHVPIPQERNVLYDSGREL